MSSSVLSVSQSRITEGDIVTLSWQAPMAASYRLTIDNGHRSDSLLVEQQGSKRFRLNRIGATSFTLTVDLDGKLKNYSAKVKVRRLQAVHAETIDNDGKPLSRFKEKWLRVTSGVRFYWQALPADKQLAYKVILAVTLCSFLSAFPRLAFLSNFLLVLLVAYLAWFIVRRHS